MAQNNLQSAFHTRLLVLMTAWRVSRRSSARNKSDEIATEIGVGTSVRKIHSEVTSLHDISMGVSWVFRSQLLLSECIMHQDIMTEQIKSVIVLQSRHSSLVQLVLLRILCVCVLQILVLPHNGNTNVL